MTAVVGIMNKRGIAIAADSAVTMTRDANEKIANSANKMIRLSSAQPVSVMITGNADFLRTPWDVIVRRYRQKRGLICLPTVEAVVNDFLAYIPTESQLFNMQLNFVLNAFETVYYKIVPTEFIEIETDDEDNITNLDEITEEFLDQIDSVRKRWENVKSGPAFDDYPYEAFLKFTATTWEQFVIRITKYYFFDYPKELFENIKDSFLYLSYLYLKSICDFDETELVFTGYGSEEDYPTLISVSVSGGFDHHVCYRLNEDSIVHITDDNESAICPFAQTDIMEALLTGIHPSQKENAFESSSIYLANYKNQLSSYLMGNDEMTDDLKNAIDKVKSDDIVSAFKTFEDKRESAAKQSWLKALKNYNLQDMARLAENLVAITGFERHMTFQQEGVGGPIDLAVITKNDGFVWLNRKSWYNHQDVGGRYGRFGV